MRVLQVGKYYEPEVGGIETHLGLLARGLRSRGIAVEVLVHNRGRSTMREVCAGVPVTRVATLGKVHSTELSPALVKEMWRDYDVIHLHTPHPVGMLAYLLSRKPRNHLLVVTHHSDIVRQARLRELLSPLFRAVMLRAGLVIATSRRYLESSKELAPYRDRTRVIPYGIELSQFAPDMRGSSEAQALRRRYPGPITFAVGRLIYYKGFEVLLDAFSHVPGTLLLVGEGPLREALEQRARANGVAERVHFLGAIPNGALGPYYAAADLFVLPSVARSEAFGIVQIEALGAGLPVVNTALDSGVPEVSVSGVTGLTVPPGDARALAAAMNSIFESPARATEFGRAARARALRHFTQDRMVDDVLAAYRAALEVAASPFRPLPAT